MRSEIKVSGIVQGVGFRPFIYRTAVKNGLVGYVRNRGDAVVEIVVEGNRNSINQFITDLREKKPPLARIYHMNVIYDKQENSFTDFNIVQSSGRTELSGSVIPPDVSICSECLKELREPQNRRFNYFFITCTNCGPRYTIINELPYDRKNTTMKKFSMCDNCTKEYQDPSNRRFHAQTVACPKCGPEVYLASNKGELIETAYPIRETGRLLEEGSIVAIKGNGGFHVATSTILKKPIARLRKAKHRKNKPFAILAPNLKKTRSFAKVSPQEAKLLTSYRKPIILLKKNKDYFLSDLIAPKLDSVGVMLPYTGLHSLLFDNVKESGFIMTSANPPNEPIVIKNQEAITKLGSTVDYFLFHNRPIAQRCDDSVVRFHGKNLSLIRRSRGYAPEPLELQQFSNRCVLAVGGELNVTSCILNENKAFISQHLGDIQNLENLLFLKDTITHLLKLTNCKIEAVACDLHPKFTTTKIAHELGKKLGCPIIKVQHHHAHAAALMAEWNINKIIAIACDGFGYGPDGSAWGGEVLYSDRKNFSRVAHLKSQPMVGGELATYYPLRMTAGILHGEIDVTKWLFSLSNKLPHGSKEAKLIIKQLNNGSSIKTTSCGRVLDAVSATLGICYERTYEGEPAMKLESMATKGKDVLNLTPKIEEKVLDTTFLLREIFNNKNKYSVADLACSAQSYLAKGLAQLAIAEALRLRVKNIGFSGGVAYNEHITEIIRKKVEDAGLKLLVHTKIPTGDGGISFGQAIVAGFHG